jgi:DEAD/DEAH box helicase domain-containing protein
MAYDTMSKCDCQKQEHRDGCYRCLLAYRGRHFKGRASRAAAMALLEPILREWDAHLKRIERLESVRVNRLLESELEASFIEALRRPPKDGEPLRVLSPHVMNGKQGWYLKITGHGNWLIQPQVELGTSQTFPCRRGRILCSIRSGQHRANCLWQSSLMATNITPTRCAEACAQGWIRHSGCRLRVRGVTSSGR